MIELGKILIKDQTSILEARNKIGLLAEDLKFNSFDTTRLATVTSELSRIIYEEGQESNIEVGFDKKEGLFGLLLIFQTRKEGLDTEKAEIFFDRVKTFYTKDGFQRVETFRYIPDPKFKPTKEFIDLERERLVRFSRAELFNEVKRKNKELLKLLDEIKIRAGREKKLAVQAAAAAEAERRRAKYSDLYDFAPVGYLTLNKKGLILEANLTACSKLGKERSFLISINNLFTNFIIKKEEEDLFYQHLRKVFEEKSLETCELELKGKDNTKFYAQLESIVVKDNLSQCRTAMTDITERKRLEEDLKKSYEKLKKLDQVKSDFISTVSHELRTPLSITKEGISLVLDKIPGKINEKQGKILTIAKNNIDRLARIINSLLDISKIEAGEVELKKEKVKITNLIEQVISSFKNKIKKKGLELKVNFPKKGIYVYVESDKIVQVFTNLLGNALKFTEKGCIEISAKELEDEIEFVVSDTGIGISKDDLPKTFSKFQQFGRVDSAGEKGTGLGLSIVKGIVEMHYGKIWVESTRGKGSKFIFTLPKYITEEIER